MNIENKDKIVARIKACLELSKDGTHQAESDTAMRMAKKLMAKHDLSMSDIDLFDSPDNTIEELMIDETTIKDRWDWTLVCTVMTLCNVRAIRTKDRKDRRWFANVSFVGYKQDVLLAKEIYVMLRVTAISMAAGYSAKHKKRHSYLLGLTDNIHERAQEEIPLPPEQKIKYGALVIAKEKNISIWINKSSHIKGSHRTTKNNDIDPWAYAAGQNAGKNVALKNKKEVEGENGR